MLSNAEYGPNKCYKEFVIVDIRSVFTTAKYYITLNVALTRVFFFQNVGFAGQE